jgi:hypothetical protein
MMLYLRGRAGAGCAARQGSGCAMTGCLCLGCFVSKEQEHFKVIAFPQDISVARRISFRKARNTL